jgi:hypothetical protein
VNKTMKDNYGNDVPDDLVLIPDYKLLTDEQIKQVTNARWYWVIVNLESKPEPSDPDNGICELLCVSAAEIKDTPCLEEDKVCGEIEEVILINDVLKRWSAEDGFYFA